MSESRLACPTSEEPLKQVAEFLSDYATERQLSSDRLDDLRIIADELISNSIKYGNANVVELLLELVSDTLKFIYKDDGQPFNPLSAEAPDLERSVADRDIGGLGLLMIQSMTETQHYEHVDGMNVLVLTLRIE